MNESHITNRTFFLCHQINAKNNDCIQVKFLVKCFFMKFVNQTKAHRMRNASNFQMSYIRRNVRKFATETKKIPQRKSTNHNLISTVQSEIYDLFSQINWFCLPSMNYKHNWNRVENHLCFRVWTGLGTSTTICNKYSKNKKQCTETFIVEQNLVTLLFQYFFINNTG